MEQYPDYESILPAYTDSPVIGLLWGDFPWEKPAGKVGKLLSMGAVARNITHALNMLGTVRPWLPPKNRGQHEALATFLRSIDLLWADVYPHTGEALQLRHALGLACPVFLFAGGALPKAAEAMLLPWQQLLRADDRLIFTSHADQEIWHRLIARSALREYVIPIGLDTATFYPRDPALRLQTRSKFNLPLHAPVLLYVGRLNIQKNLHTLLYMLAHIRREIPEVHLALTGEDDDIGLGEFGIKNTGYRKTLNTLAEHLGISAAVTFTGPVYGEQLGELYGSADVLVNASFYHRENFGLSQAEAQLCGLPVVCSDWGGFKDIVRHGETGYLMDAMLTKHGIRIDWASGARSVIHLLQNPALRARMSAQAEAWAKQQFSIDVMGQALKPVVANAIAQQPGRHASRPAYEPSAFAYQYEDHKHRCGWYVDEVTKKRSWYPPMFTGSAYGLYEHLMLPYATRLAADLSLTDILPSMIPYCSTKVAFDLNRRIAYDGDLVWPHHLFLDGEDWAIIQCVDGKRTVAAITAVVQTDHPTITIQEVCVTLRYLHIEGFILFAHHDSRRDS